MTGKFSIEWIDHGREPQCPPDPAYPQGRDLPAAPWAEAACKADLPYPAKRCGYYDVTCAICGSRIIVTTAGRPDDPRSVMVTCQPMGEA